MRRMTTGSPACDAHGFLDELLEARKARRPYDPANALARAQQYAINDELAEENRRQKAAASFDVRMTPAQRKGAR